MVSQLSCSAVISTLLVTTLLSSLILSQPTPPTHQLQDVYLVSVRNNNSTPGLDVTLTSLVSSDHQQRTLFVANHRLSSKHEGVADYFRHCELFVERRPVPAGSGDSEIHVVFVPLKSGVLLLSVWYGLYTEELDWSTFIVDSPACSPTVIYKADGKFYTVCISVGIKDLSISVYELHLQLNGSPIGNGSALFRHPLTSLTHESTSGTSTLSNIVVDESNKETRIYLAIGNNIYSMLISDATHNHQALIPPPQCDQIHKLALIESNRSLIAYCTDVLIIFDVFYAESIAIIPNSIPFLCPDSNYKVWYDESKKSLQLTRGLMPAMVINVVNINNGVCFEVQDRVYFVYSDRLINGNFVYVYSFFNINSYPISHYNCTVERDCPQLLFIENHFLVIQTEENILVLDAETNFHLVINTTQEASLLTVLSLNKTKAITPAPPSRHTTTTSSPVFTTCQTDVITDDHLSRNNMRTSLNVINTPMRSYASLTSLGYDATTVLPYPPHRVAILTGTFTVGAIILIATSIIIGIFIKFHKKRYSISWSNIPRLRFVTDKGQSFPKVILLKHELTEDESASTTSSTDSDSQEDDDKEQGDNSYGQQPLYKVWETATSDNCIT